MKREGQSLWLLWLLLLLLSAGSAPWPVRAPEALVAAMLAVAPAAPLLHPCRARSLQPLLHPRRDAIN